MRKILNYFRRQTTDNSRRIRHNNGGQATADRSATITADKQQTTDITVEPWGQLGCVFVWTGALINSDTGQILRSPFSVPVWMSFN